jgi:hypothetical protein
MGPGLSLMTLVLKSGHRLPDLPCVPHCRDVGKTMTNSTRAVHYQHCVHSGPWMARKTAL